MYRWVTRLSYHAILEDNVFENTAGCGINVTGRLGVREGPVAFDVLLRRNVIQNCDVGVDVFYRDAAGRRPRDEAHIRRLEIVSNRFERVDKPFALSNTLDVKLLDNVGE